MIVFYLFLKTFAILLAKILFISDTHTIITARVNKLLKLQSGEFEISFLDYINQELSSYPYMQVGLQIRVRKHNIICHKCIIFPQNSS